jgi:predicted nucleotide-binding protein (sugar kinase/HSP70/actin superfamily)
VLALSRDRNSALITYSNAEEMILDAVASMEWADILGTLKKVASMLSEIPLHTTINKACKIALVGEIYVRRDAFSHRYLVDQMAERGIVTLIAPVIEWVYYTNYLASKGLRGKQNMATKLKFYLKALFMERYEKTIKDILVKSNLYDYHLLDIKHLVESVSDLIDPQLTGEAILTLSCALNHIIDHVDGVISIGPFGCMPARIAESMIKQTIDTEKIKTSRVPELAASVLEKHPHLPFISIESDGSPFPPVVEAGLESFVLQAKRIHKTKQGFLQS